MARRSKKRRGSGSKKIPLAIGVPLAVNAVIVGKYAMEGNFAAASKHMTGYGSGGFEPQVLMTTYGPILAGVIVHKGASKLGVNRMIPKWLPVSI